MAVMFEILEKKSPTEAGLKIYDLRHIALL